MLEPVKDAAFPFPDGCLYGSLHEIDINSLDRR